MMTRPTYILSLLASAVTLAGMAQGLRQRCTPMPPGNCNLQLQGETPYYRGAEHDSEEGFVYQEWAIYDHTCKKIGGGYHDPLNTPLSLFSELRYTVELEYLPNNHWWDRNTIRFRYGTFFHSGVAGDCDFWWENFPSTGRPHRINTCTQAFQCER